MERHEIEALIKNQVSPLQEEITNLKNQVGALEQQLAERDQQLAEKDQRIAELEEQIQQQQAGRDQEVADLERRIQHCDSIPPAQRQQEEKSILKDIRKYLQDHPLQSACMCLVAGAVIGAFLVYMGLPLLASGAAAAGTAVATVGAQGAGSATIGQATVKFVVGILLQTISK